MDLEDSMVKGGVLIVHHVHEGKHQYKVENVKYKRACDKAFARRGDKLMQINGIDLQDLTPEELAQSLATDNPMLTVHKASRTKEHTEQVFPAEDTLHPFSKESTVLSFSMEMRREEDLQQNEVGREAEREGGGAKEEEVCQPENKENGERGDLLIISMTKTSISVVSGRGCDNRSPCQEGCKGTGCTFNEVVMVSESSEVMLVPRGGGCLRLLKSLNTAIEHLPSHLYLRGLCSQKAIYASPNPEEMTIYYYKSTSFTFRGQPVVLNFSKSNCFLRCCKEGDRVFLQVETCEKQRLKKISKNDEGALSFVFYMKAGGTKHRTFESALHGGWFIQIDTTDLVAMATLDGGTGNESFLFVIQT
uniref:Interleukin-1 beta n=2 Tax=Cyclopterus lumpus TaxID=8103 RepID=A0A6M3RA75_CYCLU|nr:putative interleukin 1 family member [Cyclopterus lumpus]